MLYAGGIFSYFSSTNTTLLGLVQHAQLFDLGGSINQHFTAAGAGAKFQLNPILNIEVIYTKFIGGKNPGLGQTFNLGLSVLFN